MELSGDAMIAERGAAESPQTDESARTAGRYGAFFDCAFVWTPRELVGPEPYVVFEDDKSQTFAAQIIQACRGEAGFRGVVREIAAIPGDVVVICDAPAWRRCFEALTAAGVRGPRARVLLYFDVDPTGFWDFAEACGSELRDVFLNGVNTDNVAALSSYLETWAGARVSNGRIAPYAGFYTRDFYPLHEERAAEIVRVMAALADDESRAAYARILFGTPEQVFGSFASSVWGDQQYMAIVKPEPGDVIINCGVGRGWELPYFLARLKGEGHIHNIDPNMVYFSSHSADFINFFGDMISDLPIVAGDRDGTITLDVADAGMLISSEGGGGSASAETYPMRSIDSLMAEGMADRLDYLKMDVEGGERTILRGAVETIRKHRPKLAVAIYHQPEHFWEYPSFILDHFEDYRLYVRQYGYSRFETLLYAVPAEAVETTSGAERLPARAPTPRARLRPTSPMILSYLRDAPGAERAFYSKPLRALTRVSGVDWDSAELTPGPDIGADVVEGVLETRDGAVILTRHHMPEGRTVATLGISARPTEMHWTHVTDVAADARCLLVDSDDAILRFAVYSPSENGASLFEIQDEKIVALGHYALDAAPIATRWRSGAPEFVGLSSDGGTLRRIRPRQGGGMDVAETPAPPGDFLGLATLRHADGDRTLPGLMMRETPDAAVATIHQWTDEGCERIGTLAWDDRFEAIPTLVDSTLGFTPPKRPWWRRAVVAAADRIGVRRSLDRTAARLRRARGLA